MNILVINGSPRGDYSVTLQTSLLLQMKFPGQNFEFFNAGQKIKKLEKDFSPAAEMISKADMLIFSYPVYTFLAPCQLHRFIELMKENDIRADGKIVTQITTSKHFYDVTAHRFIEENCLDMGFGFIEGLSADMDDLTTAKGREQAVKFFSFVLWSVENGIFKTLPRKKDNGYCPVSVTPAQSTEKKPKTVAVVTDLAPDDSRLKSMIDRFCARVPYETKIINLHDFPFKGGCISCFNCVADGDCFYKDGFQQLLRDEIQPCAATVTAFTIKDHSMGSVLKTYDDRQFCNGHRTVSMGKPCGYLVSGCYSDEPNLKMVIDGRAGVGGNYLAGVATDEKDPDGEIENLCRKLGYAIENGYNPPADFLGVGGMKIFRDLIWLMQGMMKADHRFYKEHGQYDFPQKHRGRMIAMYAAGAMMNNKKIKAKIGSKINDGMLMPYKKALKDAEKE